MRKDMCAQIEVLKKIRKAGKMNGYATEWAEAQAEDFISFRKEFKNFAAETTKRLIEQGAQLDLVVRYVNGPAEQERKDGIVWKEVKAFAKNPIGKIMIVLFLGCVALAGQRILELFGIIGNA